MCVLHGLGVMYVRTSVAHSRLSLIFTPLQASVVLFSQYVRIIDKGLVDTSQNGQSFLHVSVAYSYVPSSRNNDQNII